MTEGLHIRWPQAKESNRFWGRELADKIWPGGNRVIDECQTAQIYHDKDLRAIFAFHNWDEQAGVLEVSAWSCGFWSSPWVVYSIYSYAFDFVGCQAIAQRNDPDNHRLNRLLERAGFAKYEICRIRGRHKSELVYVLTDDVWRDHPIRKRFNRD